MPEGLIRLTQLGPQFSVRREQAMQANLLQPRTRHQRGQALQQLQGRHEDMDSAVAPYAPWTNLIQDWSEWPRPMASHCTRG